MSLKQSLMDLAVLTLRDPQAAARHIISFGFDRNTLWSGLALVAVANTFIFTIQLRVAGDTAEIPQLFLNPLAFFVILSGVLVLSVHAFYWAGLAIGGKGDLGDLLVLMVWLQALRAAAQIVLLVLLPLSPLLGLAFSVLVGFLGLWILINFIATALQLSSMLQGVVVLVLAAIGMVIGLLILAMVVGLTAMGVPTNV